MRKLLTILLLLITCFAVDISCNGNQLKLDNTQIYIPKAIERGLMQSIDSFKEIANTGKLNNSEVIKRNGTTQSPFLTISILMPVKIDGTFDELETSAMYSKGKYYMIIRTSRMSWVLDQIEVNKLKDELEKNWGVIPLTKWVGGKIVEIISFPFKFAWDMVF